MPGSDPDALRSLGVIQQFKQSVAPAGCDRVDIPDKKDLEPLFLLGIELSIRPIVEQVKADQQVGKPLLLQCIANRGGGGGILDNSQKQIAIEDQIAVAVIAAVAHEKAQ